LDFIRDATISTISKKMIHFKDYYYYLKSIRWILNNSLAEVTIPSSSTMILPPQAKRKQKAKHRHLAKEEQIISAAPIPDLEMWSEYKINRMAEESGMD
jgi:hypothetical protein